MADVKPASLRGVSSTVPARIPSRVQVAPRPPIGGGVSVDDRAIPAPAQGAVDHSSNLIAEFIQPAPRTMAWLSDPRLSATLKAASDALAPGGVAEDVTDRYAASVLETHLVARRRLTKLTNSLLKT